MPLHLAAVIPALLLAAAPASTMLGGAATLWTAPGPERSGRSLVAPESAGPALGEGTQLEAATAALSRGDTEALGAFLEETVELVLPGVEDIVTRAEATRYVEGFLTAHPPIAFAKVHDGTSGGSGGAYLIGSLDVEGGGSYRVYVYGRERGGVMELRIERE